MKCHADLDNITLGITRFFCLFKRLVGQNGGWSTRSSLRNAPGNPMPYLIPVLQYTVQIASNQLGGLSGMPLYRQDRRVTRLDLVPHFTRLPVPKADIAAAVSRADKLSIRTDCHVRRIAGNVMTPVALLAVLPEAIGRGIYSDLVVGGLEGNVFS